MDNKKAQKLVIKAMTTFLNTANQISENQAKIWEKLGTIETSILEVDKKVRAQQFHKLNLLVRTQMRGMRKLVARSEPPSLTAELNNQGKKPVTKANKRIPKPKAKPKKRPQPKKK